MKRRSQAERREDSERRLLQAAAEVFADQGFSSVTLEQVCSAAGVSRGLASARFGSKEGLMQALIRFLSDHRARLIAAELEQEASPLAKILKFAEVTMQIAAKDTMVRAYYTILTGVVADKSDQKANFVLIHEYAKNALKELVLSGMESGEIRSDIDAEYVAFSIGSMIMGIGLENLIDEHLNMDSLAKSVLNIIAVYLKNEI